MIFLKQIFLFLMLGTGVATAQHVEQYQLGVFHKSNGNIRYIKNGKRIIVRTEDGKHFRGPMLILGQDKIQIKDHVVEVSEFSRIKLNPIGPKVVGAGIISLGMAVAQLEFISSAVVNSGPFSEDAVSPGGTGLIILAAGIPFFVVKRSFLNNNWIFKIVPE